MSGWIWAALLLYVTGLFLAFGVRTWTHWRSTGSTGFRGVSGPPGSLAWCGGALFAVALVMGVGAPILALTGMTSRFTVLVHPAVAASGLLLALLGLTVTLGAQSSMGRSWRIGVDQTEQTDLVNAGLFRWVRNPIFTGMATVSAGVALMVPTPVAVISLACLVAAVQIQVRATEEPYLLATHGKAYADYCATTGRFIPRLGRANARPTA